jgi:ferredoxin-NADP reductase
MVERRELRVSQMTWEADGVVSLRLARIESDDPLPPWEPGAHIDVHVPDGTTRQYSLCGDPGDLSSWQIAVLREPEGRGGSAWIHDELRVGDRLLVTRP